MVTPAQGKPEAAGRRKSPPRLLQRAQVVVGVRVTRQMALPVLHTANSMAARAAQVRPSVPLPTAAVAAAGPVVVAAIQATRVLFPWAVREEAEMVRQTALVAPQTRWQGKATPVVAAVAERERMTEWRGRPVAQGW